jgi:hypothetical protein
MSRDIYSSAVSVEHHRSRSKRIECGNEKEHKSIVQRYDSGEELLQARCSNNGVLMERYGTFT